MGKISGSSGSKSSRINGHSGNHGFYYRTQFDGSADYILTWIGSKTGTVTISCSNGQSRSFTINSTMRYVTATFTGLNAGTTYNYSVSGAISGVGTVSRVYIGANTLPTWSYNSQTNKIDVNSPYTGTAGLDVLVVVPQTDHSPIASKYSRDARTLFFEVATQYTEVEDCLGKISSYYSIIDEQRDTKPAVFKNEGRTYKFWDPRYYNINVKVIHKSGSSSGNNGIISSYVNDWIAEMNTLLGGNYFKRDDSADSTADETITLFTGTHQQLWGYNPDDQTGEVMVYYGTWESWVYYDVGYIAYSEVNICNEIRGAISTTSAFKDIVYEELTEACGTGNDQFRIYDSMFSEIWYEGKTNRLLSGSSATLDGQVVQIMYLEDVGRNVRARDLIDYLCPSSSGCISLTEENDLSFLTPGRSYTMRMFSMNRPNSYDSNGWWYWHTNCRVSRLTANQTVTITSNRPSLFYWTYGKTQGAAFNLTAAEWNALTQNINEVRVYKGLSNYSFNTAYVGGTFTAIIYNQARVAIQAISGYGSYIPTVSSGQTITAYMMNILVSELNAIP